MYSIICQKLLKFFCYLFSCLILFNLHLYGSARSDDEQKRVISSYLIEQGDSTSTRPINLHELHSPVIIDDHSHLRFGSEDYKIPTIDNNDRKLHYLLGSINQTVYRKTSIGNINFLILALDATVLESTGLTLKIKRISHPIYFDRTTRQLTLNAGEYAVFLSASGNKNKRDREEISALSENAPFAVKDSQQNTHHVYFHPFNISINGNARKTMARKFSEVRGLENNYDSEVHAVFALITSPTLISSFFLKIKNNYDNIISIGLRYYSFLDMCSRCQEFLVDNQAILKPLFMGALNRVFNTNKSLTSTPFIVVAHSNRIYGKNEYKSKYQDITTYTKVRGYQYAVSGPQVGEFVDDSLLKYGGDLIPSSEGPNQLIAVIDEPDLGDQDQEGIVRHTFTHLKEAKFSDYGLTHQQGSALAAKLTRANSLKIKKANFSKNYFGIELPDFADDPITITSGTEISDIFDYLASCINLEELHFSKVHLSAFNPFNSLCESLPKLLQLRILDVSECSIDHESFPLLASAISNLQTLQVLNLSKNFIYFEGLEILIDLLPKLTNLRTLGLAYAALCHRDGRERVGDPFIESLVYDSNVFLNLAKSIKIHPTITSLDISHYKEQIKENDLNKFRANANRINLIITALREKYKNP